MAPKMALRRLLPELWRGCRLSSTNRWVSDRAIRYTHDSIDKDYASLIFSNGIGLRTELPGLVRRDLDPETSDTNDKRVRYWKRQLSVFSDDLSPTSPDKLKKDFAWFYHQGPEDDSFLSALNYAHDTARAALSVSPSTQHALVRHNQAGFHAYGPPLLQLKSWALLGVLSRQYPSSNAKKTCAFHLRIGAVTSADLFKIGPCDKYSIVGASLHLNIELRLQPKILPLHASLDKSANALTQSVTDVVTDILGMLRQSLLGREYTSGVSMNEAMAMHLKEHFRHSKLEQYLELESISLTCDPNLQGPESPSFRWVHEGPRLRTSPYYGVLGGRVLPRLSKYRRERIRKSAEKRATLIAEANEESHGSFQISLHPYTLDITAPSNAPTNIATSAIALRFDQSCAGSVAKDLPSMLDSFLTISQDLPTSSEDDIAVKISHGASALPAPTLTWPTHFMEFKKDTASKSINVSIHIDLQRSFQLRFNSKEWKDRQIQVKRISFQTSPLDTVTIKSLLDQPVSKQVSIKQEMDHLATNATAIVRTVCEGVKFDDVTTVTGYLAEAALRVVRPLTTGFLLERVSIDVVIGDDLVTLTNTISVADLRARSHASGGYTSPSDYVDIPSGYQATVSERRGPKTLPSNIAGKTGFTDRNIQLLSYPAAEYRSSDYCKVADMFDHSLEVSQDCDFYSMQAIVCNTLKGAVEGEEIVVSLQASDAAAPSPIFGNSLLRGQIAFFSDGDIVCTLDPITHITLALDDVHEGGSVPVIVQIWLKGAPTRQIGRRINARQQMDLMHKSLASKLSANLDGLKFRNLSDSANNIADMVHEAKSELEEHFVIDTVSVEVSLRAQHETGTVSAQQDSTTVDADNNAVDTAEKKPAASAKDSDLSVVEPIDPTRPSKLVSDEDGPRPETHIPMLSAGNDVSKYTVAIKALLQELDSRLYSLMPTLSTDAVITDGATRSGQPDPTAKSRNQMQRGVVVALGSNVGNRIEEIEKACRAIDADPDMRIVDTSFLYETKPMYVEDQGSFINGACEIETSLSPIQLLDRLQAIEQGHGRVKLVDKGPRNIDLDIAIFRDEVVETKRLTIPHMLMHEREFVMRPIMDLTSMHSWRNPRTKQLLVSMFGTVLNLSSAETAEPMHAVMPLATSAIMYPGDPCRQTLIMSILNTTPDSFSDGESNTLDPQSLRETVAAHIAAGATIIDVGGQSSRPNAPDVTAQEETDRVLPAIAAIRSLPEAGKVAISVDTYRAATAEAAVNAGAHIVNDISAGALDPQMLSTVARLGCTYIMMHMRGTPATMQNPENCTYERGLRKEIVKELRSRVALAIEAGVRRWRIILDPGIGFAKTHDQNIELLRTALFRRNGATLNPGHIRGVRYMPQLVGSSRKGFIGSITGVNEPRDRVYGTAAAVTASIRGGADIVRVHDVQEMVHVAKMADAIYRTEKNTS